MTCLSPEGLKPIFLRYSRRMIGVSLFYAGTIILTTYLIRHDLVTGWIVYPLAILPALGVIGMFGVIVRLLIDLKADEYQQRLMVLTILWSTGFILTLSTIWDFLQAYAGMPPMPPFVISVGWIAGFGIWGGVVRWIYK